MDNTAYQQLLYKIFRVLSNSSNDDDYIRDLPKLTVTNTIQFEQIIEGTLNHQQTVKSFQIIISYQTKPESEQK